ncbi:MAG: SusC/RagA family TonB-linked outer membrane protein [Bacteroidetes bacterium]|nr:SusC/RagA family TonB-linked outer membrane protein [Bacteroidota bacterium]
MKKTITVLLLFLFAFQFLLAQTRTVTGTVLDEVNLPLPGVNIVLKGTAIGTVTDFDGTYSIEVPSENQVLEFSFTGYKREVVDVSNRSIVDLSMAPDTETLDEIVVTALAIERQERSLGYAQQTLESEDLNEIKESNIVSMLAGKVSGVQVTPPPNPTGSSRIIIRGNSSIAGNNQPMFVVDGVPIDNGGSILASWGGGIDYGNNAANINPDDIESMQVLKGPNAAALYGSRAANGVIMITTKQGRKNTKARVNINSNMLWNKIIEYPEYQNVYGSGSSFNFHKERFGMPDMRDYYRSWGPKMQGQEVILLNGEIGTYDPQPDNVKNFYQTAHSYFNSLSIDGGTETLLYRFSYSNLLANSIVPESNLNERHTLNFRGSVNEKKFKIDTKFTYTIDDVTKRQNNNGSQRNPANVFIFMPRDLDPSILIPWKNADGTEITTKNEGFRNPYWAINEDPNEDTRNRVQGFVSAEYRITDWLRATGRIGGDFVFHQGYTSTTIGSSTDLDGAFYQFNNMNREINTQFLFIANKDFGKIGLSANFGGNRSDFQLKNYGMGIRSLIEKDFYHIRNSNEEPYANQTLRNKQINSLFGTFTASYNNYLFLDLSARNDWSSTLPEVNNSYFYPAANLSFIFTDAFELPEMIEYGKIRGSYAVVGNDPSPYQLYDYYSFTGQFNGQTMARPNTEKFNQNLKPELTSSYEIGLEMAFFNNRANFDATYYKSFSREQILSARMPGASGYSTKVFNAGEIQNFGVELTLNVVPVLTNGFKWSSTFNFARNNSSVVKLIDNIDQIVLNNWWKVNVVAEVGYPYGLMRGVGWAENDQGEKLVYGPESGSTLHGRPIAEENMIIGNSIPDWLGSFSNEISYKGASLRVLLDCKMGGDMFSATYLKGTVWGTFKNTLDGRDEFYNHSYVYGENPSYGELQGGVLVEGVYPTDEGGGENTNYNHISNWYLADRDLIQELSVFDASYIKLREVALTYNLPKKWISKLKMGRMKVGLVGRNLAILYRNTPRGLDPEASVNAGNGQGIEFGSLPPMGSFGVNLNVEF